MAKLSHPLLQALITDGVLTDADAERVFAQWKEKGGLIDDALFGVGITDDVVAKTRGKLFGIVVPEIPKKIPQEILHLIPENVARNYLLLAYALEGNVVSVGLVDPENPKAREVVEFLARQKGLTVQYGLVGAQLFQETVKQYQQLGKEAEEVLDLAEQKFKAPKTGEEEGEVLKSAPVSQMVASIVRHAVEERASDIHIEPFGKQTRVRYRVDGILHTSLTLPHYIHAAIVSRIKVLASLKLDETRLPQDGRIKMNLEGHDVDLRVSTLPLMDQEKVVIRILDTSGSVPTLEELGFRPGSIDIVKRHIIKPNGLFLMTGPTGSGKTTTLYAMLSMVNREGMNIVTLEDPVEYYLPGINQSQVNSEIGFTFAAGLRSILRQDPNVIMVGEIRDRETGELAVHAGLTGHLVFSTLHTKEAFGAIPRLIDMGIEPFLISSTVSIVMAQRLVRRVCSQCQETLSLPPDLMKEIEKDLTAIPADLLPQTVRSGQHMFYRGKGCARCGKSGYQGRTTVIELIEMTQTLQNIIASGNDPAAVREELKRQKFVSMRQDGIVKALQGMTTIEEILRVTRE